MATLMDTTVLSGLSLLWPFLLTFCLIYGVLASTKILGDKSNGLNAIIAFVFGILVLFSDTVTKTINRSASWMVLLIFFLIFLTLMFRFFGATEGQILSAITGPQYRFISFWIVLLVVIIVLGSLTSVLSDKGGVGKTHTDENGSVTNIEPGDSQQSEFWQTIAHPKVLGALFLLLVAVFTITRLTTVSSK